MPLVLLVRHGENDYVRKGRLAGRLPNIHLNEKGRAQAQAVAEALSKTNQYGAIKAVYSSPMERTMETAAPIAAALNLDVIPRPGLMEVDFGEWENKKVKGLSRLKIWRKVQQAPSLFQFPGGETFHQAQHRICQEIESLATLHEQKDVFVCVGHSDPIKLAVAYYIGLPLDLFQRLSVSPASISVLFLGDGVSRLLALNAELSLTLPKH
jgi:probable phosphomutase (TIGR03848 family)